MTMGESHEKANNDPWVPLPEVGNTKVFPAAPSNPLYDMIDSDHYIQSLERKLERLTKKKRGGPTSHDIITSLAVFHEDQMKRFIDTDQSESPVLLVDTTPPLTSFIQRKLHPAQPVSGEELLVLVAEDMMAKEELRGVQINEPSMSDLPGVVPINVQLTFEGSAPPTDLVERDVNVRHSGDVTASEGWSESNGVCAEDELRGDWAKF